MFNIPFDDNVTQAYDGCRVGCISSYIYLYIYILERPPGSAVAYNASHIE